MMRVAAAVELTDEQRQQLEKQARARSVSAVSPCEPAILAAPLFFIDSVTNLEPIYPRPRASIGNPRRV